MNRADFAVILVQLRRWLLKTNKESTKSHCSINRRRDLCREILLLISRIVTLLQSAYCETATLFPLLSRQTRHVAAGYAASMLSAVDEFLNASQLLSRDEVLTKPFPIPASPGVYGWWFDRIPAGAPTQNCAARDGSMLLYVGISPKAPPMNGKPPSKATLQSRVRYHYTGNAEGSTLRLTLGVLLAQDLGIELRRVGSGTRRTFSAGEQALSAWMADHARVSFVEHPTPWTLEEQLISTLDLPLNLDQNHHHSFHAELGAQRRAAKTHAATLAILPR